MAVTPEAALDKNVLSLRQQPPTKACRFDIFVWIPQQPNPGVHVAAQAAPGSPSALWLAQLGGATSTDDRAWWAGPPDCGDGFGVLAGSNAMDGHGGQVQTKAACIVHCAGDLVIIDDNGPRPSTVPAAPACGGLVAKFVWQPLGTAGLVRSTQSKRLGRVGRCAYTLSRWVGGEVCVA